jgi:hypothetical protein
VISTLVASQDKEGIPATCDETELCISKGGGAWDAVLAAVLD